MEHSTTYRKVGRSMLVSCYCGATWSGATLEGPARAGQDHVSQMEAEADDRPFCAKCDAPHFGECV